MKTFNLNNYVLVAITPYGWKFLEENYDLSFIENCIKAKAQRVDGKEYHKLQAHNIADWFGKALWCTHPAPIESNILIPEPA